MEPDIGSTAESLTASLSSARSYGDGCRLNVASTELLLYVGGYSSLTSMPPKAVSADIVLASQPGNTILAPVGATTITTGVAHLIVRNDPDSPLDTCIAAGGENAAGTAQSGAYRIKVTKPGASFSIAVTAITGLTARTHFQMEKCGSNALIAVSGDSGGTIQVLKAGAGSFTSVTGGTLSVARKDFGLSTVADGNNLTFNAIGGHDSVNGTNDDVDVLQFNAACNSVTKTHLTGVLTANGREEMVAFETNYDAVNKRSKIIVPGGLDGAGSTLASMDTVVINLPSPGTPSLSSTTTTGAALQGTTRRMALVVLSNGDAYISGGSDGTNERAFVSRFAANGAAFANLAALSTAREGHAFFELPTANTLQIMAGQSNSTTVIATNEVHAK